MARCPICGQAGYEGLIGFECDSAGPCQNSGKARPSVKAAGPAKAWVKIGGPNVPANAWCHNPYGLRVGDRAAVQRALYSQTNEAMPSPASPFTVTEESDDPR